MKALTVFDYWKKQPLALAGILSDRASLTAEFVRVYQETRPDRVYLVGSGTSFNAEAAAASFMESVLGIEVGAVASSSIPRIMSERPLVVFLSQDGSSTNTLAAMDRLAQFPHIAITGEAQCKIQDRSTRHMLIGCGAETVGPKTMGYTSSVMVLYVAALDAALASGSISPQAHDDHLRALATAASDMAVNLTEAERWLDRNSTELETATKYVIVGRGIAGLAATEGALKVLETVRAPAIGYEFEEYLHGPMLMADNDLAGLFFITEDEVDKPRMLTLADCHQEFSPRTYRITSDRSITDPGTLHVRTTGRDYTEVFEFVIVPQLLGAVLPGRLGLDDGSEMFHYFSERLSTKWAAPATAIGEGVVS